VYLELTYKAYILHNIVPIEKKEDVAKSRNNFHGGYYVDKTALSLNKAHQAATANLIYLYDTG
jgi:hypothetical protein